MIITISGVSGSGKSTIAKELATKLSYRHHSVGEMQRQIAEDKGISILELGVLEKKDDSIDRMIDARQVELGRKEDNFVIDSWLGACFIPHSFKILLTCSRKERARRIFAAERGDVEKYSSIREAEDKISRRDDVNRERWIRYYKFDYLDRKNYDLVVSTTSRNVPQILSITMKRIKSRTSPSSQSARKRL